jgi:hypothetical protein
MKSKPFPIRQGIPCQLKWNHSTVFLTMGTTASCHRVTHDFYEINDGRMEFHNIEPKMEARKKMLRGEWPGRGCEHCKSTEDAGGHSDRMSHLDMPGVTAPKELKQNKNAVSVTPTQLEIYFSNTCNLKCIYCNSKFSSTIDNENRIYGEFLHGDKRNFGNNVYIDGKIEINPNIEEDTNKLFSWLEKHIHELNKVMILGGEPFLQKETERMIQLLERTSNPKLTLVIFSNLTVDPVKVQGWLARTWQLVERSKLHNIQVVGSLDCWGPQAEYVRNGLNLKKYVENFEFILNKTRITPSINSAMTALTIPTLPALIQQMNTWSKTREVYWSGMKAGDAGRPYLNPTIFGEAIIPLGLDKSIELFETNNDPIKQAQLSNLKGIRTECANTDPDQVQQKLLKVYLQELDRRRGTNYANLFPTIAKLL